MEDYQRALYDFTVAIRVEQDYLNLHGGSKSKLAEYNYNAGYQHYNLQQFDEALNYYNESIRLNSQHSEYLFYRGLVQQKLDMVDQAVIDFENAIEILNQGERDNDSMKMMAYF